MHWLWSTVFWSNKFVLRLWSLLSLLYVCFHNIYINRSSSGSSRQESPSVPSCKENEKKFHGEKMESSIDEQLQTAADDSLRSDSIPSLPEEKGKFPCTHVHCLVHIRRNWKNSDPWDKVANKSTKLTQWLICFFCGAGIWTQGLMHVKKAFIEELYSPFLQFYLEK